MREISACFSAEKKKGEKKNLRSLLDPSLFALSRKRRERRATNEREHGISMGEKMDEIGEISGPSPSSPYSTSRFRTRFDEITERA